MNSSVQGIIIALLIGLLIGFLVGYYFVRNRLRQQAEQLKVTQRRLAEIEQSHELRLREATEQLRRSYEAELAETIEHYQDQLSQKTIEMEKIYETRFQVLQRGEAAGMPQSLVGARMEEDGPAGGLGQSTTIPRGTIEPLPDETAPPLTQPELLHLKKQYEMRLKEAAQKLQQAYEQQLAEHAKATRANYKAEFEKRLAEQAEAYEQQLAEQQAQIEADYTQRLEELAVSQAAAEREIPTPSEIMGTGDETTVTLSPVDLPEVSASTTDHFTADQLQTRIQEATELLRQEYEAQLEAQQEQFDLRLQDLEAEYKRKMEEMAAAETISESPESDDDDFGPLDLSDISQLS